MVSVITKNNFVDMWYNDKISDVTRITIRFYDRDVVYRGNIFIGDKIAGDYQCDNSVLLQKWFSQLEINWE